MCLIIVCCLQDSTKGWLTRSLDNEPEQVLWTGNFDTNKFCSSASQSQRLIQRSLHESGYLVYGIQTRYKNYS